MPSPKETYRDLVALHRPRGVKWAVGNNASHLPMALWALAELGAEGVQMQAFADHYIKRLPPPLKAVPDLVDWQASLKEELPWLLEGASAAAFHGLLRTAYGVMSQNAGEVAEGMAYWRHEHFPISTRVGESVDLATALEALCVVRQAQDWQAPLIMGRLVEIAGSSAFQQGLPGINTLTLNELALRFARLYAQSLNFTVLHCLTACHALKVLVPYLAMSEAEVIPRVWPALAAAFTASNVVPDVKAPEAKAPEGATMTWPEIIARTQSALDDHDIKLVFSCRFWENETGDDIFRVCAARTMAA